MKLISLLACFSFAALPQAPASDTQTLQTLLAEVHQLRIVVERSAQIVPRVQIAVERLKMQQEQVTRVARQLDDVRHELDNHRLALSKMEERLKATENAASQSADPQKRKDFIEALSMFKSEAEAAENPRSRSKPVKLNWRANFNLSSQGSLS